MKKVNKENLERDETYLVFAGYQWSPSGYDIAEYQKSSEGKSLISQSNGEDILPIVTAVYELPKN